MNQVHMYLSIVVPCFNEEAALPAFCHSLQKTLSDISDDYEVILVDDGSSDQTSHEARRLNTINSRFQCVSLSRNFGKESALLAGLLHAGGTRVAMMDADLQHPPDQLARMLALLESGYDQVIARRTRHGEKIVRSMLSRLYYWGMNRLSHVHLEDGMGDFRVLSRRAVDAVLSMREHNRFSKGLFAWIGFKTTSVSYTNVVRDTGRTKFSLGALINHAIDGLISFNNKPLRVSIYLGALVAFTAFVYVAFVVVNILVGGVRVPGYATLMASIVGLGGLHMLFLGVIGEYLGRIYIESKRRPHFLVRETTMGISDSGEYSRSAVANGPMRRNGVVELRQDPA